VILSDRLTVVVMMPALNEEKTIGEVIERVPRDIGVPADIKVLVVDDGSEDRTSELARERGAIVIRHPRRRGLGRSFAVGLERALEEGADIVVNIDADGQFDAARITDLVRPILEDEADFVTASRFASPEIVPDMPVIKKWGNRQMSHLVNFVTGTTDLTDVSCGFRAYNLRAALHVHLSGHFTHTHETIIDLADKGLRLTEVPMKVRGVREHGKSRMAAFVPRYAMRAGVTILRTLCRTRPLVFFGGLGGLIVGLGVLQGMVVFVNWWLTHRTHPFQSLLLGASLFITLGFLVFVLGFIADMMNRAIGVSEKLLFFHKLEQYRGGPGGEARRGPNGRIHARREPPASADG
jgi:glycosyltransferase involved in cell wall biosynthesis